VRTQTIVGTAAALILLVSKYGFSDVLQDGLVVVDPSRVAAQIVSGIGFLGAGIIIFRRGSVHGLTTAAAVWESAAIGMAAGAGLLLLAVTVTAMHFLVIVGFLPLARWLSSRLSGSITMHVSYEEGHGVMSRLLQLCDRRQWQLTDLAADAPGEHAGAGQSGVLLTLAGRGIVNAPTVLAGIDGVTAIHQLDDEPD
jgi:putative Mg2+ transporter-C (MgtC) family protein